MSISLLGLLLASSLVLGLLLTPVARHLAQRWQLVDRPDGRRKMQEQAIPLAGGIAVFLATLGGLLVVALFVPALAHSLAAQDAVLGALLLASVLICAVGLLDDFRSLRGRHKLFGQLLAVSIVMGSGLVVHRVSLFAWQVELGILALPFTAFWLLGAINSLNLIDGMDGLLGSVGVIIALTLAAMAVSSGQWASAAIATALAGALLAFLCFNFPPASIYLGDCGSMLVGLVVGVLAMHSSLKGPATVALAAPAALFIIPIFDTATAIVRRKLTGRSIYSTDRGHLHHVLLRSGRSTRGVLLLVSMLCMVTVLGVLASVTFNSESLAVLAAVAVIAILVVGRLFGYAEFLLIKERLRAAWSAWRGDPARQAVRESAVHLQGSAEWKELWASLTACAAHLNLTALCLDLNAPALHEGYHARWDRLEGKGETPITWSAVIPLVVHHQAAGRLEVTGLWDDGPLPDKVAALGLLAVDIEEALARLTGLQIAALPAAAGGDREDVPDGTGFLSGSAPATVDMEGSSAS